MKQSLFRVLLLSLLIIHFTACDNEDYKLPPISETVGNYTGNYKVYKNDIETDKGNATLNVDLIFDDMHPIALKSSDFTIENNTVFLNAPCNIKKKANTYSLSEEQRVTIPSITGFKEHKTIIEGELDGRTLKFTADIIIDDINPPYHMKIIFEGKKQ